jgi:hypothetical protein
LSIVTPNDIEAADVFPARSVAFAVIVCAPDESGTSIVQFPEPLAVTVPRELAPSKSSTVLLFSAVEENVRFVV